MSFSYADFIAMQARVRQGKREPEPAPSEGVSKESNLHDAIIAFCKSKGWVYFHGSMAHKAMRTVGENDFHCLLPGGVVLFIECKTRIGKLTPDQLGLKLWMEKLGHTMHVVRSLEDFVELSTSALRGGNLENSRSYPLTKQNTEGQHAGAGAGVDQSPSKPESP